MSSINYNQLYEELNNDKLDCFSPQQARNRFLMCARHGVLKHAIPEEYAGYADGFTGLCKCYMELGKNVVDPALIISLHAHIWGSIFPILRFGSEAQKQMIPFLIDGSLIAGHAITEPESGSDLSAMQSNAQCKSDGYILNGHKRYITNAAIADIILVYALLEGNISAFFVKKSDQGVEFLNEHRVSGFRYAPIGEVVLKDCFIPKDRILGGSEREKSLGSIIIQYALELERAFLFSGVLGVMQWQLAETIQYAKERQIRGEPLGVYQAVSHKIADMRLKVDVLKMLILNCAQLKDNNKRITLESSEVKLFASESFLQSSLDAVQIFGGKGLEIGAKIGALVQDACASRIFSGSSEVQRNIISALMGLRRKQSKRT